MNAASRRGQIRRTTSKRGGVAQMFSRLSLALAATALVAPALAFAAKDAPACQDLPTVFAAPEVVLASASLVAATASAPEYCDVRGAINGHIKFAVFLPSEWNQRFEMVGNGGKAGVISFADMATAVA